MPLQQMDNAGIAAEDLDAAVALFTELGPEVEGWAQIEGLFADQAVGPGGVRSTIAMMRTPDGHGKLELAQYRGPRTVDDGGARSTRLPPLRVAVVAGRAKGADVATTHRHPGAGCGTRAACQSFMPRVSAAVTNSASGYALHRYATS